MHSQLLINQVLTPAPLLRCPRELLRIYGQKVDLLADRLQPVQRPAFFLSGNSVRSQTSTAPVIEAVPAIGDTAAVR